LGFKNAGSNNKDLKRNKKAFNNNNIVNTNNKGSRASREIEEEEALEKKSQRRRGLEEGDEFKTFNLSETHFVQTPFLSLSSLPPANVKMIFN